MSVDPFSWLVGVATTVVGSWVALKIHIYYDSKKTHLDDLKKQILESLADEVKKFGSSLYFSVDWGLQQYRDDAPSHESPLLEGPVLRSSAPGPGHMYPLLDQALLEDARTNHYAELMSSWESFRDAWTVHLDRRRKWIESIAQHILKNSGLPAYPSWPVTEYVMHLRLALFTYNRLMQQPNRNALSLSTDLHILMDGDTSVAVGPTGAVASIADVIDATIDAQRARASELRNEFARLESDASSLSRKFSLEIANKQLPRGCKLVPF